MKKAGYSLQEIALVLQHKSLESLKHYLDQATMEDRENFSKDLFKGTGGSLTDSNDDLDFEPPPPPKRKPKVKKIKKTNKGCDEIPQNAVAIQENKSPEKSVPSSQNVMQMYKQNPIGMFVGAQLSNCTININMPK